MKLLKSVILIGLLALGLEAKAQDFRTFSFLNARSLQTTNTIGITNLATISTVTASNVTGTVYTNTAGTRVLTGPGTNEYVNLLKTINLWADRNGSALAPIYTNQAPGAAEMPNASYANIYIRIVGGSGANSAVTFGFVPVPSDSGVDSNVAGDLITVAVTANTTTQVQSITRLDYRKVANCKGLMCKYITNGDGDASSGVTVLECSLNGFVP